MSEVAEAVATARVSTKLGPSKFSEADYRRAVWYATPPFGTTMEEITKPAFWAHVCIRLRPLAEIIVVPEGNAFYARLLVLSTSRVEASVRLLEYHALKEGAVPSVPAAAAPTGNPEGWDDYLIKYVNPSVKHRVQRKVDKAVLKDELETQEEAEAWLRNHLRK